MKINLPYEKPLSKTQEQRMKRRRQEGYRESKQLKLRNIILENSHNLVERINENETIWCVCPRPPSSSWKSGIMILSGSWSMEESLRRCQIMTIPGRGRSFGNCENEAVSNSNKKNLQRTSNIVNNSIISVFISVPFRVFHLTLENNFPIVS